MSDSLLTSAVADSAPQFTVPAAAEAVAAAIGDREFIIQGRRRYTYAQVVDRASQQPEAMRQSIQTFAFKRTAEQLQIKVSELENSGILGAAALYLNTQD